MYRAARGEREQEPGVMGDEDEVPHHSIPVPRQGPHRTRYIESLDSWNPFCKNRNPLRQPKKLDHSMALPCGVLGTDVPSKDWHICPRCNSVWCDSYSHHKRPRDSCCLHRF